MEKEAFKEDLVFNTTLIPFFSSREGNTENITAGNIPAGPRRILHSNRVSAFKPIGGVEGCRLDYEHLDKDNVEVGQQRRRPLGISCSMLNPSDGHAGIRSVAAVGSLRASARSSKVPGVFTGIRMSILRCRA